MDDCATLCGIQSLKAGIRIVVRYIETDADILSKSR